MDYKKIFNESNLEKQEESKMRLNECGGGKELWDEILANGYKLN